MHANVRTILAWSPAALLAAALALSCSSPGLASSNSSSSTTGSVSGHAYFSNQSDNSGILISAESTSSGKTVYVRSLEAGTRSAARSIAASATTASSGAYTLGDLPPGIYTVYASSKNSLEKAVTTSVTVAAGKDVSASDLDLTATGSISGTISISGASPLGTVVYIAGTSYAAIADSSGSYAISTVPVGTGYTLYAEKGSYDSSATVSVTDGVATTQNLTLTQLPALSCSMTLEVDASDTGKTKPGYYDAGVIIELSMASGSTTYSYGGIVRSSSIGTDTYFTGYLAASDAENSHVPVCWVNPTGTPTVLPFPTGDSGDYGQAQETSIDANGDILIRGDIYASSGQAIAGYWEKNSGSGFVWTALPLGSSYAFGSMGAGIWTLTNGTELTAGYAQASSSSSSQPVLWILGNNSPPITLPLTPFIGGGVGCISLVGTTLYFSGDVTDASGNSYPAYWSVQVGDLSASSTSSTFSSPVLLPQNGYASAQCWGPASLNGSLFFFGETGGWSTSHPIYWRDGSAESLVLPSTAVSGYSNWCFSSNGTLCIEGSLTSSTGLSFPVVWKNGEVIIIDLGTKYLGAMNFFQ